MKPSTSKKFIEYKRIREDAWRFYNQWRSETTYSPALKSNIIISLQGWKHIERGGKGKRHQRRNPADAVRRFRLLRVAKNLILTSNHIQNVRHKGDTTFYSIEGIVDINEFNNKNNSEFRQVRVIIKQGRSNSKIFFSVMTNRKKIQV